jgi:hypothetical protein
LALTSICGEGLGIFSAAAGKEGKEHSGLKVAAWKISA